MVLTVDVGNTNIVFGGFEGDTLRFTSRIRTDKYQMRDEYAVKFLELSRLISTVRLSQASCRRSSLF